VGLFQTVLVVSVFLCSLVAGFLFSYAVVVMPGIKQLNDRDFIRAYQVTDRIIQNNQPLFILVWVGSALSLIASAILGIWRLQGFDLLLLTSAALAYILVVQISTIIINLPLNNKLQSIDVGTMSEIDLKAARNEFESRWNTSNNVRTIVSCSVSALLIILLLRQ